MAKKTDPFTNYPAWTTSRFFSFIRSALRSAFNRYPPKFELLKQKRVPIEGKRHKFEYQCNECKQWFQQKEIQVDHIIPAGQLKSFEDIGDFCKRLFCGVDDMQILCKPCHKIKTKEERNK